MKNFDYYFSNPTQNYLFNFRTLFSEDFKGLSVSAKALYALMVERANLSNHNNWFDNEKRVYIIYTAAQVMEDLQCSERTALKLLAELATFGLIERFQNKKGQAYIIYVKLYHNIEVVSCDAQPEKEPEVPKPEKEISSEPKKENEIPKQEEQQEQLQRPRRPLRAEFEKLSDFTKAINAYWLAEEKYDEAQKQREEKEKREKEEREKEEREKEEREKEALLSASPAKNAVVTCKNCSCHLQNLQSSNINSSNNNFSIYKSYQHQYQYQYQDKMDNDRKIHTNNLLSEEINACNLEEANSYREFIKKNIEYFAFQIQRTKEEMDMIDNLVEIIVNVMTTKKPTIRIAGEERDTEVVKSVYSKLNLSDIDYVLRCLINTESKITNIVSYTRTVLYNARQTRELHYRQRMHFCYPVSAYDYCD